MALRDLTAWFKDQLREDGWFSLVTGLGGARDRSTSVRPIFVAIDDVTIEALYLGNGLAGTIVDAVPDDAIGTGISTGSEALDQALRRTGAIDRAGEAWRWGRAYGRGAVYIGLSDRLGPQSAPVALEAIQPGDLTFLEAVDGIDLTPSRFEESRASASYGRPSHYWISGARVGQEIHASRFVFFGGALTPARTKINRSGKDLSVLQRPYDALRDEGSSNAAVISAFQDLSQAVFKIKDLVTMIANGQASIMRDRMEIVDLARSVSRAVVLDADGESFEHVGAANLTGVDALQGRILQRVASWAGMPATRLLGVSPVGMNATGESDLRIWYKRIEVERQRHEQQIATLIRTVARANGIDWSGEIRWPALWTPTPAEKAAQESIEATTDAARIASGVIDAAEAREIRLGGASYHEILEAAKIGALEEDDGADPEILRPASGETWIDTGDQHRLQVTAVANGRIFFLDLDSADPARQYAWAEPYFVERARRVEVQAP